jgi:hypothetical protein
VHPRRHAANITTTNSQQEQELECFLETYGTLTCQAMEWLHTGSTIGQQ